MQLDPSSSSISTPTNPIPSEQPLQVEIITYMDSDLFKAAEIGDMELFNKYQAGFHCLVDRMQNTVLHIYSRTGGRQVVKIGIGFLNLYLPERIVESKFFMQLVDQISFAPYLPFVQMRVESKFSFNFVQQLVDKCPSLLQQPNAEGEIPLHVAARHGHSDIVKFLIARAKVPPQEDQEKGSEATTLKQMLRMTDNEGNTAMHKAVESGDLDVVRLLVKELDADFSFSANASDETPLFIAAKAKRNLLVAEILENCKSIDYGGPDGRTALNAAVMVKDEKSMRKLIEANKQLTKETDNNGWTPLHYAAYYGFRRIVKLLLESDASAAYMIDKDRGMTALHMAAWRGRKAIMEDIISHCPGCCEIVDKRGWNFLHFAVVTLSPEQLEIFLIWDIVKLKDLPIRNLLDKKDANGNRPFHVLIFGSAYTRQGWIYEEIFNFFERHGSEKLDYVSSSSKTKREEMTALHLVAWKGIMEDIISYCPGCCEIVEKRGWNFLHFAVLTLDPNELDGFLLTLGDENKIKDLPIRNPVNEKYGNTLLHLLMFGPVDIEQARDRRPYDQVVKFFERHGAEKYDSGYMYTKKKKNQIQQLLKDIANDAEVLGLPISSNFRMIVELEKTIPKHDIEEKARESHLLVATLVATVTFTAAFTVPGGYKEQQGTATLVHNLAFKAFVMTNTLAFSASLEAITLHFIFVMFHGVFKIYCRPILLGFADFLTVFAIEAMVIAFSTGTYAVLQSSSGVAVATLVIGLIFSYISLSGFISGFLFKFLYWLSD